MAGDSIRCIPATESGSDSPSWWKSVCQTKNPSTNAATPATILNPSDSRWPVDGALSSGAGSPTVPKPAPGGRIAPGPGTPAPAGTGGRMAGAGPRAPRPIEPKQRQQNAEVAGLGAEQDGQSG